jgi:hypothetical protein
MSAQILGYEIGRQFIGGDEGHFEWRIRYQRNGGGLYHHLISSRRAPDSWRAMEIAQHDLGQIKA